MDAMTEVGSITGFSEQSLSWILIAYTHTRQPGGGGGSECRWAYVATLRNPPRFRPEASAIPESAHTTLGAHSSDGFVLARGRSVPLSSGTTWRGGHHRRSRKPSGVKSCR
jgi:hypothetical protein